jgi:hypothetical protein
LYAPSAARLLAYAECSVQVLLQDKKPDCGCTLNVATPVTHDHPATDNKQKDISLKTDWKFIQQQQVRITFFTRQNVTLYRPFSQPLYNAYYKSIFHPPGIA